MSFNKISLIFSLLFLSELLAFDDRYTFDLIQGVPASISDRPSTPVRQASRHITHAASQSAPSKLSNQDRRKKSINRFELNLELFSSVDGVILGSSADEAINDAVVVQPEPIAAFAVDPGALVAKPARVIPVQGQQENIVADAPQVDQAIQVAAPALAIAAVVVVKDVVTDSNLSPKAAVEIAAQVQAPMQAKTTDIASPNNKNKIFAGVLAASAVTGLAAYCLYQKNLKFRNFVDSSAAKIKNGFDYYIARPTANLFRFCKSKVGYPTI